MMQVVQAMSDDPLESYNCNKCNKLQKVKRVISGGAGMIFKGSGFYLTDYTDYGKNNHKKNKTTVDSKENNSKEKKKKD